MADNPNVGDVAESAVSQVGHTPGPWDVRRGNSGRARCVTSPNGRVLNWNAISQTGGRAEANARLIAAAPDLLAACQAALGAFEHNHAIDWSDLSRAISKATLGVPPDSEVSRGR